MKKYLFISILLILTFIVVQNISKKEDIKIGLVAGLSGKYSSLGHDILNGTLLAFDEINYNINGKKVEIIRKDDKQNDDEALQSIKFFEKEGINLIIGNATSSMTNISLSYIKDKKDFFLISPTASSSKFSNIDDNFLRTQIAHSTKGFNILSNYLLERNLRNVFLVYDPVNKSYVDNYLLNFQKSFLNLGGKNFIKSEKITNDYKSIIEDINKNNIDVIVVAASALDSSNFIQYLRINGIKKSVIVSGWAKTKEFLENGGIYVNGAVFATSYDANSENKKYLNFLKSYVKKYKTEPSVFSARAYETAKIIIQTLKKDTNIANIKKNILFEKTFDGLQGKIVFNKFGDVDRDYFLMQVKDNSFVRIH